MSSKIKFLGNEPENIKKRIVTLFTKLDEAYPDKVIYGLYRDHKKWGETVTELYRALGYESSTEFLNAYGYKVRVAEPKNSVGRTKTVLGDEIIAELQRRYPNGSEYTKADDLFAANPDLETKKKTLANQANEMFGMPLGKYLISIGLIQCKTQPKEEDTFDYEGYLKEFADEVKKRLVGVDFIPDSTSKLPDSFANMDFQLARRCVKKVYGDAKTLDTYLQEVGALRTPLDENAEMLYYVDILKARYKKSKKLPTKLGELASENPDLPIRNLNKYIREVIGETKAEKYYIRNRILQGQETDLIEYDYCKIKCSFADRPCYYISTIEDLKLNDKVIVDFGWRGKVIGEVFSIETYIGLNAPEPVSRISPILRRARDEEITSNAANWTEEDHWLYEWRDDDSSEEDAANHISALIPSPITYLEGKRALIDLVQTTQAINSIFLSPAYDRSMFSGSLSYEAKLKGATCLEDQRICAIITRVHNTGRSDSIEMIEQLQEGDSLSYTCSDTLYIKSKDNRVIGHISNEVAEAILPMLKNQYSIIKDVTVTYVRPLSKMTPEKKHPALYVMLLIELVDVTKDMVEGSCVALYSHDWKADATKISFLKTSLPLDVAKLIFKFAKRYSYDKPFSSFCRERCRKDPQKYKIVEPYLQVEHDIPDDFLYLYEWFSKYAVDESKLYFFGDQAVDYATWDISTIGGFHHMGDSLFLFDISADYTMALDGEYIDEIVLTVG